MTRIRRALASLNCDGRYGIALLAAAGLLLLPEFWPGLGGDPARAALRFERSAIAAGQWWRLLTAHLVHLGAWHALLNCAGLALLWALFARAFRPGGWLVILLASAAAIDAGLWWGSSTVQWYVGSSGVLHGAMAAGTLAHWRAREPDRVLLAGFLLAKLAWEQVHGALPFAGSGAPVLVAAHLYGAAGGVLAATALTLAAGVPFAGRLGPRPQGPL